MAPDDLRAVVLNHLAEGNPDSALQSVSAADAVPMSYRSKLTSLLQRHRQNQALLVLELVADIKEIPPC